MEEAVQGTLMSGEELSGVGGWWTEYMNIHFTKRMCQLNSKDLEEPEHILQQMNLHLLLFPYLPESLEWLIYKVVWIMADPDPGEPS